jgi:hypothetical protein
MPIARRFTPLALIFVSALTLQAGSAFAQTNGGTTGSGEIPLPPPHCVAQVPQDDAAIQPASFAILASTSYRVMLSRLFAFPVSAPSVSARSFLSGHLVGR